MGNTTQLGSTTTSANRRAMPFIMPEDGTITSVSMWHAAGSGDMLLGVYSGEGSPTTRLAVTPVTAVAGSAGFQTINLTSPAEVPGGTTVWLAWVYQSNPGIAYTSGSPGRVDGGVAWSGGMPDPFGSSSQANFLYSIYANYTPGITPPVQYTLTTNTVGNGSVSPSGGTYNSGTNVTLTATPDAGYQFDGWSGDASGTTNPLTITMDSNKSVTATFSLAPVLSQVGNTAVFGSTSVSANRRAMPFTMPETGTIQSVSMYHEGGSGQMYLAVYDGTSLPANRLAVTPVTNLNSGAGFQTINLASPVTVTGGDRIWLAWVYSSNPGIRYQTGTPGRADAGVGFSGGMPTSYGSSTQADFLYSIYANYTTGADAPSSKKMATGTPVKPILPGEVVPQD